MWPFKPKAQKSAIATLLTALDQLDPLFLDILAYSDAKSAVRSSIKTNPDSAEVALLNPNRTVHAICLSAMAKYLENELASGQYHIYRGTLSGQGADMRALFRRVLSALSLEGEGTDEDVIYRIAELNSEIGEVG